MHLKLVQIAANSTEAELFRDFMLKGKEKRILKSLAKTRPVDLKIGKNGITDNFLVEARRILERDGMIKFSLLCEKQTRKKQIISLEQKLGITLLAMVGKSAAFHLLK